MSLNRVSSSLLITASPTNDVTAPTGAQPTPVYHLQTWDFSNEDLQQNAGAAPSQATTPIRTYRPTTETNTVSQDNPKSKSKVYLSKGIASRWCRLCSDTWILELLSAGLASILMGVIAFVLWFYNGKGIPQLPYGITLNTVVSILATTSRSLLLLIAASVIGQDKWLCSRQSKPLIDLQTFDGASRGPCGALGLLSTKFWRVAGLGGLVTILALALEPTTQQVIVFQDRNIASTTANSSMPFAIEPANDGSGVELAAIKGVIADDVSELTRNIAVDCPGGNCTFAPFESLAMCSRCQDITAEVQALNQPWHVNWTGLAVSSYGSPTHFMNFSIGHTFHTPRGASVDIEVTGEVSGNVAENSTVKNYAIDLEFPFGATWDLSYQPSCYQFAWDYYWCNDLTIAGVYRPDVALGQISFAFDTTSPSTLSIASASECALSYCVQGYERSVSDGQLSTKVTHDVIGQNDVNDYWSGTINGVPYYYETVYTSYISKHLLSVLQGVSYYLPACTISWTGPENNRSAVVTGCGELAMGALDSSMASMLGLAMAKGQSISDILSRVANATSIYLQASGTETREGTIWSRQTFVHVRWVWLALPTIVVILTCVALGWAIWQSRSAGIPLWRTSLLPLFYRYEHDQAERGSGRLPASNALSTFEQDAETAMVSLMRQDEGADGGVWTLARS